MSNPWLADAATGATGQTFEIRSVEDFFKVPEGRRRICLREFHVWMSMLDGMEELFGATRDALGIPAEACGKKRFDSERQAKQAHANASYRIRAYRCEDCHGGHVTNSEKRASGSVKHYGRGNRW